MWKLIPSFVYSWGKVAGEPRPKSQKNKIMTTFVIVMLIAAFGCILMHDPFENF